MLVRIVAPHFVAGVVVKDEHVILAAPILRYMVGWHIERVTRYCADQFWKYQLLDERIGA